MRGGFQFEHCSPAAESLGKCTFLWRPFPRFKETKALGVVILEPTFKKKTNSLGDFESSAFSVFAAG